MQPVDNIAFHQVLRIKDTELWQTKDGKTEFKTRGFLQVLYAKSMKIFMLKLNDYKFALNKSLEIVGSFSDEEKYQSYMIPTPDGFFMLKMVNSEPGAANMNLETILSNTSHFILKTGPEQNLGEDKKPKMREGMHKMMDAISNTITPSEKEDHPNQKFVRSFSELMDVETIGLSLVDIPSVEVQNAIEEAGEITRHHQTDNKHWNEFKGSAVHPVIQGLEKIHEHPTIERWGSNITDRSEGSKIESEFTKIAIGKEKNLKIPFSQDSTEFPKPTGSDTLISEEKPALGTVTSSNIIDISKATEKETIKHPSVIPQETIDKENKNFVV